MHVNWLFRGLAVLGVWGALSLSWVEWQTGNGCPKLWVVPACYLIAFVFLTILQFSFVPQKIFQRLLWGLLWFGFLFSGIASFTNWWAFTTCPLTSNGLPMCYLAFGIFTALLVLQATRK